MIKRFYLKSSGAIKPSSEALTHATVYGLDAEIGAVIHIHSFSLWNFMLNSPYKKTKNVPYGSVAMIQEVKRIYQNQNPFNEPIFAMSGHKECIISFGKTLKDAEISLYKVISDMIK